MESALSLLEADWVWVVINIVLPILLPVAGLWLMRVSLKKPAARAGRRNALATRRYLLLFKDGQLGWVALLMCFAAVSEFSDGLFKFHRQAPSWTIVFFLVIAGVCSLLAFLRPTEPSTPLRSPIRTHFSNGSAITAWRSGLQY